VRPPGGDHLFVNLRVEELRDRTSFTLLGDLPLHLIHGSVIRDLVSWPPGENIADSTYSVNCSIASSTESLSTFARLPSVTRSRARHTLAQNNPSSTRSDLLSFESWMHVSRGLIVTNKRKGTLIIVRRALTEPKTPAAGVIAETSSARFRACMAASNLSHSFRWDSVGMVETGGSWEKRVWRVRCEEEP